MKNPILNESDTTLLPYLSSVSRADSECVLADLLAKQIEPTIKKTLRSKLHVSLSPNDFSQTNQDALEVASEVKLVLITELGRLKSSENKKVINNLNSYVASVTINAYRQYLRAKYPLRQQLKNKLRYLLTHHPKFDLWEDEQNQRVCGYKKWLDQNKKSESPSAEMIQAGIGETVDKDNLRENARAIDLLIVIFEFAKAPMLFNELISIVAEVQGVKDQKETSESETFSLEEKLVASDTEMLNGLEQREHLKKIWLDICELPVRHRAALLLNLRDKQGDCLVWLLPLLRIASVRQIAEALEFEPEDFAAIWRELPWEDAKIAEHLGLTRQQVINLRQSARLTLKRKMKGT